MLLLFTIGVAEWPTNWERVGQAYRGLSGGFVLLRIFSVAVSVSPHVCFCFYLRFSFDFYVSNIMHL